MPSASSLIIMFILVLIVAVLVIYLLIGGLTGNVGFIESRLTLAKSTLTTLANGAISTAESIVGEAFDFANQVVSDIDIVLQAVANSFAQLIETVGQALVDVINFLASYTEAANAALVSEINGFFNGLIYPIFDTITNIINTITSVALALIGTFDPFNC